MVSMDCTGMPWVAALSESVFNMYLTWGPRSTTWYCGNCVSNSETPYASILTGKPRSFAASTIFRTSRLVDIPAEQHSIILNIDNHPQNVNSYCGDDWITYGNRFPLI